MDERPAKQWPPERTARSTPDAAGEGDRPGDVGGRGAAHDGLRADVGEKPVGGRRTDSYPSAPGTRTSPAIVRCSSAVSVTVDVTAARIRVSSVAARSTTKDEALPFLEALRLLS